MSDIEYLFIGNRVTNEQRDEAFQAMSDFVEGKVLEPLSNDQLLVVIATANAAVEHAGVSLESAAQRAQFITDALKAATKGEYDLFEQMQGVNRGALFVLASLQVHAVSLLEAGKGMAQEYRDRGDADGADLVEKEWRGSLEVTATLACMQIMLYEYMQSMEKIKQASELGLDAHMNVRDLDAAFRAMGLRT